MLLYPRVLVFGDSIVWGSFDTEAGGWVNRLQASYMHEFRNDEDYAAIYNCGISGDRVAHVLDRFDTECKAREPRSGERCAIVVAVGINDSGHDDGPATPVNEFTENYRKLLAKASSVANENVLAVEPTNIGSEVISGHNNSSIETYVNAIRTICTDTNTTLVQLFGKLEREHLSDDLLHPSPIGHAFIKESMQPFLDKLIKTATIEIE